MGLTLVNGMLNYHTPSNIMARVFVYDVIREYIRVRWPLISEPIVLLLAAILFSGWVVMESRGIELETFKSEPLEILLNGFDAKSRDYLMVTRKAGQNVDGKMIQLEKAVEGPELRLKDE